MSSSSKCSCVLIAKAHWFRDLIILCFTSSEKVGIDSNAKVVSTADSTVSMRSFKANQVHVIGFPKRQPSKRGSNAEKSPELVPPLIMLEYSQICSRRAWVCGDGNFSTKRLLFIFCAIDKRSGFSLVSIESGVVTIWSSVALLCIPISSIFGLSTASKKLDAPFNTSGINTLVLSFRDVLQGGNCGLTITTTINQRTIMMKF
mmetsp:Transcript_29809/g.45699  ORF Transcript_29809/g.45699 Transcript_29809/m.45699 type:complete len:203 (+) Transcript_29809:1406-2014(+)